MASWQFDVHVVPRESASEDRIAGPIDDWSAWRGRQPDDHFLEQLGVLLPEAKSWDDASRTWGQEEGTRVDVSFRDDQIDEVFVRVDLRSPQGKLLEGILSLARAVDAVFVTPGGQRIEPSVKPFLAAIVDSPAFSFVSNPAAFLKTIGDGEE
jgi:hypothetical protein